MNIATYHDAKESTWNEKDDGRANRFGSSNHNNTERSERERYRQRKKEFRPTHLMVL